MMTHKGTLPLETERLLLRPFRPDDAEPMLRNWAQDPEVTKFLRWRPHTSIEETRRVLASWISCYRDPAYYQWAIVLRSLSEPIGSIGVMSRDESAGMLHLGFCLGSPFFGRGYMTEALSSLVTFFFHEVGARRLESYHDPENIASRRVLEKCGFLYERTLIGGDVSNRGRVDACLLSLHRK